MLTEAKAAASQAVGLDQLLTTNEVARLLRVSRVTLWEWREGGVVLQTVPSRLAVTTSLAFPVFPGRP